MRKTSRMASAQIKLWLSIKSCDERQLSVNPRKSAPQSPINIFARGKLCGKKPKITPKSKTEQKKTSLFSKISDKTARHNACEEHNPPANPSSPSIILVAFVMNITQTEIIIDKKVEISLPQSSLEN